MLLLKQNQRQRIFDALFSLTRFLFDLARRSSAFFYSYFLAKICLSSLSEAGYLEWVNVHSENTDIAQSQWKNISPYFAPCAFQNVI